MYEILLPVDDDEATAREQAAFVAGLPGDPDEVDVVLTHVIEGDERDAPADIQRADRAETVRIVRERLEDDGHEVEVVEGRSPPDEAIVELAADFGVDQVLIGGRKRSPAGKAIFGSVTQSVILESPVPVTVVRADEA